MAKAKDSLIRKTLSLFGFNYQDTQEASSKDENPLARTIKKVGYAHTDGNEDFISPAFDLNEINNAYLADSYIKRALDKYSELMFKSGWDMTYKSSNVKDYINKRFAMLSDAMGIPMSQFWREISEDLVKYSNVFIAKARKDPSRMPDMPGVTVQGLGGKHPVAGYFRLPPETMSIKVDKYGSVRRYKQEIDGEEKEFRPEDIIHITVKRPAGRFFGVPLVLASLDDVRLLREIEDNVAKLLYRHLYPLFVYKVGIDKPGYEASDEEIEMMQGVIRDMPTEGGIVVPERHSIEMLKPDALDARDYLKYYEKRVFTGIGVSETVMGRGDTSNRSTAENQASEMRDSVAAFQRALEDSINYYMIREILMEGGFDPVLNPEHQAKFDLLEIDTDLKVKLENHTIYKFEHNATTHEEMRSELHLEPVSDESRLNSNIFGETNTSETDNKVDPKNQHSNESFVIDELKGNMFENLILDEYLSARNEVIDIAEYFHQDIKNKNDSIKLIKNTMNRFITKVNVHSSTYLYKSYKKGYKKAAKELFIDNNPCKSTTNALELKVDNYLSEFSDKLNNKILKLFEEEKDKNRLISQISSALKAVEYKLTRLSREFIMLSYNYGFASFGKECNLNKLYYDKKENKNLVKIKLNDNFLDKLPVHQSFDEYYLTFKERRK